MEYGAIDLHTRRSHIRIVRSIASSRPALIVLNDMEWSLPMR